MTLLQSRADISAHMAHADRFASLGHAAQAVALYRTVATASEQLGELRTAMIAYRAIARYEGATSPARVRVGELMAQLGQPIEGALLLDDVANELLAEGRVVEALAAFDAAATADPNGPRWLRLTHWYLHFEMVEQAIAGLERGVQLLFARHDLDGFIAVARRHLELVPDHVSTLRRLVRAELERGQLKSAVQTLQRLLALKPGDPDALERMAEAFADLGRLERAAEVVRRLAERFRQRGAADEEVTRLVQRGLAWNEHDVGLQRLGRELGLLGEAPTSRPAGAVRDIVVDPSAPQLDLAEFADITPSEPLAVIELGEEDVALLDESGEDTLSRYAGAGGKDPKFWMSTLGL